MKAQSLSEIAAKLPPKVCRLLARCGHGVGSRPKSYSEIARDAGLARSTVVTVLQMDGWGNYGLETIDAIMRGCNVNPFRLENHRKLLRRGNLTHILNGTGSQRRMFDRILPKNSGGSRPPVTGPVPASNAGAGS